MRGQNAAEEIFDIDADEGDEYEREVRGFHLRNGGWRGEGWNQISWRRRKRQEARCPLLVLRQETADLANVPEELGHAVVVLPFRLRPVRVHPLRLNVQCCRLASK